MIKKITVDSTKCIHCGLCIKDCPTNCIEFNQDKIPQYIKDGKDICFGCQHCFSICPTGALSFGDKNPAESIKIGYSDNEELLRLIKSRRSIRQYKNENVPKDKLDKIIEMLSYSPTGTNADNLHFSIIETKEKMDEIRKVTYDKIKSLENPSLYLQMAKKAFENGDDIIYRKASSMVIVAIDKNITTVGCETADPIIALSYLDLYAQSLGLGTLWCDFALMIANQIPEVYKLLNIPNNYTLNYIMLLGVPNIKYVRTPQLDKFSISLIK